VLKAARCCVTVTASTLLLAMLLHWSTLVPEGPDGLAAIRFTGPVRIRSLSIFPTGARPFANSPDIVAYVLLPRSLTPSHSAPSRTEPQSFFAHIYLNALPLDPTEKSARPPNALVAASVAYAGSAVEFTLPSFEVCCISGVLLSLT
jgi:hypothetical protein